MSPTELPVLDAEGLKTLCEPPSVLAGCEHCQGLHCPGWESIPGGYDTRQLHPVGTLRKDPFEEPTLDEKLPAGTHTWSADAPIAIDCAPYNRSSVWVCRHCRKPGAGRCIAGGRRWLGRGRGTQWAGLRLLHQIGRAHV